METALHLRRMANSYQVSQVIHVAAALGVSDLLAASPRSIGDLARATGTHEPTLLRLMRALEAVGIYRSDSDGRYANTELGELLRDDVPGSVRGLAAFVGRPHHWQAWAGLLDSVRTGENAFAAIFGMSTWEYRRQRPVEQEIFDRAMISNSRVLARPVAESYDFGRFATVADIGGGGGILLATILQCYPGVRGVLFDQAEVIAEAGELFDLAGVADSYHKVSGSFFDFVPAAADAYILKAIVHDWADQEALAILRTCRRDMPEHAVLLLVEQLLDQGPDPVRAALSDLNMLVGPGGQERTLEEYGALLRQAGFMLSAAIETGTAVYVIEAVARVA